ncbi:MAG: prohibitin family protein [Caldilineaceae bacterium]|nr:prohibitin family protein [Caldilineaceae bacterium]
MLEYDIDRLLDIVAWVGWVLFTVYTLDIFIRTFWNAGLLPALIDLFSFRVILPLLVVTGISILSLALIFIQPQEVGVVISVTTPGGIRPQPLRPGLHWIVPFLERGVQYPTYWQTYTMSNAPEEGAVLGDDSIRARTSDGQEVRLDCSVIFRIDMEQAVLIHTDWQQRYIEEFVRPVIRGLVRTQVSQFKVNEVNSSARKDLEASLTALLRAEFSNKGLVLDQFLLRDITFTPEYAASIEEKQIALEGQLQAQYEAEQIRNLALGRADAVEIEARAQARALKLIADALQTNPELLTYRYIEKLAPNVRVMLVPNDSPFILPLPELTDSLGSTATLTSTAPLSGTLNELSIPSPSTAIDSFLK